MQAAIGILEGQHPGTGPQGLGAGGAGVEMTKDEEGQKTLLKITNVRIVPGKELLDSCSEYPPLKQAIENQISR